MLTIIVMGVSLSSSMLYMVTIAIQVKTCGVRGWVAVTRGLAAVDRDAKEAAEDLERDL